MGSNMKLAAEKLFKIADTLEKEAADNTYFVCDGCNHTSSLADINAKRRLASETYKVKRVANVTVNDKVLCPACGDKMAYVPTDMSEKYYVEAESEDVGADIFEPVDERGNSETPDEVVPEGDEPPTVDEAAPTVDEAAPAADESAPKGPEGDVPETSDITDYDGTSDNETPEDETQTDEPKADDSFGTDEAVPEATDTEGAPEETSQDNFTPDGEENPVTEETVPEDSSEEPAPEGDMPEGDMPEGDMPEGDMPEGDMPEGDVSETPEDESVSENGVEVPKKDVPKFEKIPKDASADFMRAIAKYSF